MPVPNIRLNGYPGAIEQRIRYRWDPRTGAQTERRWIGPYRALQPLMAPLQAGGWTFELAEEGGQQYQLVAQIGTFWLGSGLQDNPVDVWELTSTKTEKDLLASNNPLINNLTGANGANPSDITVIQGLLLNPPDQPPVVGANPSLSATPPTLSANGLIVYNLMVAGVTSDVVFAPVLRHTQTVSSIYAVQTSVIGVGAIFSSATLNGLIPAGLSIALPADGSITNSNGYVFNFGWMKDFPTVTVSAYNKTQIIQDWQFGLWPQNLKGVPL